MVNGFWKKWIIERKEETDLEALKINPNGKVKGGKAERFYELFLEEGKVKPVSLFKAWEEKRKKRWEAKYFKSVNKEIARIRARKSRKTRNPLSKAIYKWRRFVGMFNPVYVSRFKAITVFFIFMGPVYYSIFSEGWESIKLFFIFMFFGFPIVLLIVAPPSRYKLAGVLGIAALLLSWQEILIWRLFGYAIAFIGIPSLFFVKDDQFKGTIYDQYYPMEPDPTNPSYSMYYAHGGRRK